MKNRLSIKMCQKNLLPDETDQVYSNTRVPIQVNMTQHESTRINTSKYVSDTSQHEST